MQLLMTVEQGATGIVRHKVNFHLLVTARHDDILYDPGFGFSNYQTGQIEARLGEGPGSGIYRRSDEALRLIAGARP